MSSFPDSFDRYKSPFQHLFHTDHVPTDHERVSVERIIEGAENELVQVDARRFRLQKIIEEHKAFISTVRLLPFEMLSYLFQVCVNDEIARENVSSIDTKRSLPWIFSHVCKSWRHIVLDTPKLWANVRLLDSDPLSIPILQLQVERSGTLPLDIHISTGHSKLLKKSSSRRSSGRYLSPKDKARQASDVVSCLAVHATRWRDVSWLSTSYRLSFPPDQIIPPFSNLRFLYVLLPYRGQGAGGVFPFELALPQDLAQKSPAIEAFDNDYFLSAPKLQEVVISGTPLFSEIAGGIPWKQLTTFRLVGGDVRLADLFDALQQLSSLIHLTLAFLTDRNEERGGLPQITLENLDTLTLLLGFNSEPGDFLVSFILSILHTPVLRRLSLDGLRANEIRALKDFAQRDPLLKKLFVGAGMFSAGEIIPALEEMNELEDLSIFFEDSTEDALSAFPQQPGDPAVSLNPIDITPLLRQLKKADGCSYLLPNVKKIATGFAQVSEPFELCAMISIRAGPSAPTTRLQRYHCYDSPGISTDEAVLLELKNAIKNTGIDFIWTSGHTSARKSRTIGFGADFDDPYDHSPLEDELPTKETAKEQINTWPAAVPFGGGFTLFA